MATQQECEKALHGLADKIAAKDPAARNSGFDRSLSCTILDLGVIYSGRLHDGMLTDIAPASKAAAQVRLELTSDDLVDLVDGGLNLGSAWASGRVKVHAGMMDMLKLRSIF